MLRYRAAHWFAIMARIAGFDLKEFIARSFFNCKNSTDVVR
jgi:hypothetical protein